MKTAKTRIEKYYEVRDLLQSDEQCSNCVLGIPGIVDCLRCLLNFARERGHGGS